MWEGFSSHNEEEKGSYEELKQWRQCKKYIKGEVWIYKKIGKWKLSGTREKKKWRWRKFRN